VLEVRRDPPPRAVEVDDVQSAGPLLQPPPRGVDRVGVVHGLALVVALDEAHGMSASNVDRRIEDHAGTAAQISAKLASNRSPAVLDFSGWNWTP
jgi:hypothetical protein